MPGALRYGRQQKRAHVCGLHHAGPEHGLAGGCAQDEAETRHCARQQGISETAG